MRRIARFFCVLLSLGFCMGVSGIAEEITLTTYYPAPYGAYEELIISKETEDNASDITGLNIDMDDIGTNTGTVIGLSIDMSGVADGTVYAGLFLGGNVGIGTTIPTSNLYIYQDSPAADQKLIDVGTDADISRFSVDEDGDVAADGTVTATSFTAGALPGDSGIFTTADGKTVTVTNGIITEITTP